MEKLTSKQNEILTVIKKFVANKGYAPTIRELCKLCNLSSTATMFVHLKNLTSKGYINQTENKFRTIELNVPNEYVIKNENVIPSGSPALVNPINIGIEEQEQNGVTVPSNAEIVAPVIPLNLVNIFLVFSGGK